MHDKKRRGSEGVISEGSEMRTRGDEVGGWAWKKRKTDCRENDRMKEEGIEREWQGGREGEKCLFDCEISNPSRRRTQCTDVRWKKLRLKSLEFNLKKNSRCAEVQIVINRSTVLSKVKRVYWINAQQSSMRHRWHQPWCSSDCWGFKESWLMHNCCLHDHVVMIRWDLS